MCAEFSPREPTRCRSPPVRLGPSESQTSSWRHVKTVPPPRLTVQHLSVNPCWQLPWPCFLMASGDNRLGAHGKQAYAGRGEICPAGTTRPKLRAAPARPHSSEGLNGPVRG